MPSAIRRPSRLFSSATLTNGREKYATAPPPPRLHPPHPHPPRRRRPQRRREVRHLLLDEKLNQFDLCSAIWSPADRAKSNSLTVVDCDSSDWFVEEMVIAIGTTVIQRECV